MNPKKAAYKSLGAQILWLDADPKVESVWAPVNSKTGQAGWSHVRRSREETLEVNDLDDYWEWREFHLEFYQG